MYDRNPEVASPFRCQAVTSSFAVGHGMVDLKRAAAFYDRVVIFDHQSFEADLEEKLGPDYEFLSNHGIIEVRKLGAFAGLAPGEPGYDYAKKMQSGFAASIFSDTGRRSKTLESLGNGMARLQAAILYGSSSTEHFTPIVTSRKVAPSLSREGQFYQDDPLPRDEALEELLPIRATAMRILFDKLPVPGREMPWDDIFRLREDAETGLYAARLRLLLQKLSKEDDRRHVEDLIQSEYAEFETRLGAVKGQRRKVAVQVVLPWADLVHGLLKALALAKPSEAVAPFLKANDEVVKLNSAESELKKDPYYLIEHVRSRMN
jgi:hypothetical protein